MSPRKRSRLPAEWKTEQHRYLARHQCKHGRRRLRNLMDQRFREAYAAQEWRIAARDPETETWLSVARRARARQDANEGPWTATTGGQP